MEKPGAPGNHGTQTSDDVSLLDWIPDTCPQGCINALQNLITKAWIMEVLWYNMQSLTSKVVPDCTVI